MAGMTDQEEKDTLNARYDRAGLSLALFTTMPNDAGSGGVEVSGGSYARISIGSGDWSAATGTAPVTKSGPAGSTVWQFAAPTANWGDVVGVGIYESTTLRHCATFATPVTINNTDPAPQFDSTHQITLQLGDPSDSF